MTKQSDIEMVAKARAWAVKAHAGQKDKAGPLPEGRNADTYFKS